MMRTMNIILVALLLCALAHAQTAAIDPALLAKANSGDLAAQVKAGEAYSHAAATIDDRDEAAADWKQVEAWYRKAAEKGDISGELHLAALYRDGGGKTIPRNMEQAVAWYRKAAEQNDTGAQGTLGVLYSMGQGVAKDDVEAYFWLDLAAGVAGPNQSQYMANRQMVGMRLTTDDLDTIREREKKWKATHAGPASKQ